MIAVKLSAIVDENRRLVIDVPEEIPPGQVELVIRSENPVSGAHQNTARDSVRAKLLKKWALVTDVGVPEDVEPLTAEALLMAGRLADDARSSLDLINEDRGEW
jgi:hypothetical protein